MPKTSVKRLLKGIVKFHERLLPKYAQRFRELATTQAPDALFIACSDSRIMPDLLASTRPGDLFMMRNVGNLVPPATAEGLSVGDLSEASAIEYAVLVLNVPNIVVSSTGQCNTACSLSAGVSKPKVLRGR
jgi:carbonic anhydrase